MLVLLAMQVAMACDCLTFTEPFVVQPGSTGFARLWLRNDSAINGCTYNMVASQATFSPTPTVTATRRRRLGPAPRADPQEALPFLGLEATLGLVQPERS